MVLPLEETCTLRIGSGDRTEKDCIRSVLGKSLVADNVECEWEGSDDKDGKQSGQEIWSEVCSSSVS
ncbi:hypothetical protein M405DRAFT_834561 [Rhizopogon salebrosus TDB-379]|nr:hypothetical protein M405DRAFT_834561 [Rhizopogon salebrosus TDB-379]